MTFRGFISKYVDFAQADTGTCIDRLYLILSRILRWLSGVEIACVCVYFL